MRKNFLIAGTVLLISLCAFSLFPGKARAEDGAQVTIRITAAGDCTLGNDVKQSGISNCFDNVYNKNGADFFLSGAKPYFEQDDLTIVNLEGTLTDKGSPDPNKKWRFRGRPEYIGILTGSSVEAVSFANNHCRDYGEESFADTVSNVTKAGLICSSEELVSITEIKGIKVGIIAVNSAFRKTDEQVDREFDDTEFLKNLTRNLIENARSRGAQLVIVNLHFGIEREKLPSSQQKELAHYAVDCGADVVLGHHPHVLESIEYYNGAYIAYSLGNFCFGGNTKPGNIDTVIWQQEFAFSGGKKTGQSVKVVPFLISSDRKENNYCPVPATGSDHTRIINKLNTYSGDYGVQINNDGMIEVKQK